MIRPEFIKSSFLFTLGGALPMMGSIVLLPFYTNYLSTTHYTQLLFYISISLFCQLFFSWSTETAFGIEYSRIQNDAQASPKFIGQVAVFMISMAVLWLTIFNVFGNYLFKLLFDIKLDMHYWPWGFYAVVTALCNAFFKTATTLLIYKNKSKVFFSLQALNFVITLSIALIGIFMFPDRLEGPLYARLISGLVLLGIALVIFKSNGTFGWDFKAWYSFFKLCGPLVGIVMSSWILGQVDRFFLQHHVTLSELNAYDLILKCFFGIEFIQNSLTAIIYPRVFKLWNTKNTNATDAESNRYFNVFTALNVLLIISFNLALPLLITWVVKDPLFYRGFNYLGLLSSVFVIRSVMYYFQAGLLYSKASFNLLVYHFSGLFMELVLVVLLVPRLGIMGAIGTSISVRVLQTLILFLIPNSQFRFTFNWFKILGLPGLFLIVNGIGVYLFPVYHAAVYVFQFLFFALLIYTIYRREITALRQSLVKL